MKKIVTIVDILVPIFLSFREGLEAVLVVVILLLYLKNTQQQYYYKYVYGGSILAIISSVGFALAFKAFLGGFSGILEKIFEGITFILSGIFIITLILWMSKEGPKLKKTLEQKVKLSIKKEKYISISFLTFTIIIREGIELVLMLTGNAAVESLEPESIILGSVVGIGGALILGILIFYRVKTLSLANFFKITNIVLIFFAAGLITYGLHELIEANLINPIVEELYNIKHVLPENFPDDLATTPAWLEIVGSLMKTLLGYNANPSLLEVIIYPILLLIIGMISLKTWKKSSLVVIDAPLTATSEASEE
ncbi:MAG: FTR1 family iron permease [Promethearchaeota archaeon]